MATPGNTSIQEAACVLHSGTWLGGLCPLSSGRERGYTGSGGFNKCSATRLRPVRTHTTNVSVHFVSYVSMEPMKTTEAPSQLVTWGRRHLLTPVDVTDIGSELSNCQNNIYWDPFLPGFGLYSRGESGGSSDFSAVSRLRLRSMFHLTLNVLCSAALLWRNWKNC